MKKIVTIMCMVMFTLNAQGAIPNVRYVVTTPLYATSDDTLTCRYYGYDADGDTLTYEVAFYDSGAGVWYNVSGNTYSTLSNGDTYFCRVRANDGTNMSNWTVSETNVTIDTSCINPFPFYHVGTSLINASEVDNFEYIFIGEYFIDYINEDVWINRTFAFMGGGYNKTGGFVLGTRTNDSLCNQTSAGDFTVDKNNTDHDDTSYYLYTYLDGAGGGATEKYSNYTLSNYDTIYTNSNIHIYLQYRMGDDPGTATYYIYGINRSNDALILFHSNSTAGGAWLNTNINVSAPSDLSGISIRLRCNNAGAGSTSCRYRFYSLENVNISISNITKPTTTTNLTVDFFTQTEGSLYQWNYRNEEDNSAFSMNTTTALNSTELRVYCETGTDEINISNNNENMNYTVGLKSIPRRVETLVTYDDGSDYYRRFGFDSCDDRYQNYNWYLMDAISDTVMFLTIHIDDQSDTGKWEDGALTLKRSISGSMRDIRKDEFQADASTSCYLIPNREYSITLTADDCDERNIGWITTVTGESEKTVTVTGTSYDLEVLAGGLFYNVSYAVEWFNDTNQVCFTYNDAGNETDFVQWFVKNATDSTVLYQDNTTASTYLSCYNMSSEDERNYVQLVFTHPDASTHNLSIGTVQNVDRVFSALEDYEGEVLGLDPATLFLGVALACIGLISFSVGAVNVGIGAFFIMVATIFFSAIGWLPLWLTQTPEGILTIVTIIIVAVLTLYSSSGVK